VYRLKNTVDPDGPDSDGTGIHREPISNLFKPGYAVTCGNGFFKLAKLSNNLDINKNSYHNRVIDIWN